MPRTGTIYVSALALCLVLHSFILRTTCAGEPPAKVSESFSSLLAEHVRTTFERVGRYVTEHPQADDAAEAYRWLFATAREHGLEKQAVPLAEAFLAREGLTEADAALARQVLSLGLAAEGKLEDALATYGDYLQGLRFRAPAETVDFATSLAARAQIAGESEAARQVYERLATAFFLNSEIRSLADARLARLEFFGRTPPAITADDLAGEAFDWSHYQGKVVLLDFWATNCAPCLEEFPGIKRLYAELHEQGFEIVGISFDDRPGTVREFQQKWDLPWRMLMDEQEGGRISGEFAVATIPSLFLIGRDGKIAGVDVRGGELRPAVEKLLKPKAE